MSTSKKKWRRIGSLIAATVFTVAVGIFAWSEGLFLPRWILWKEQVIFEEKSENPEKFSLHKKKVQVYAGGRQIWESPDDILVQDMLWCDINHDKREEMLLLCWRRGRYGNAKPFWVEEDEKSWSQHIYIYQWNEGEIQPIWMASDIGMDVKEMTFDETKRLCITEVNERRTFWDWLSWGLTIIGEA